MKVAVWEVNYQEGQCTYKENSLFQLPFLMQVMDTIFLQKFHNKVYMTVVNGKKKKVFIFS